jgi:hypothetical protein
MQNVPKSMWEATAMRKLPEVLELKERLRPLSKETSYARQIASGRTAVKTSVSREATIQVFQLPSFFLPTLAFLAHHGVFGTRWI